MFHHFKSRLCPSLVGDLFQNASEDFFNLSETQAFNCIYPTALWKIYGFYEDNYVNKINNFWLKFPPPSPLSHYILAAISFSIMTTGLFGNVSVLYLIARRKTLRTPANILVANLAVSDFSMMAMLPMFIYNSLFRGPALGDLVCRLYGFLGGLTGTVSITTLAAISLDRYYVIKFPLNRRFTNLRAKLCILITWIYGIFFSSIPLLDIGFGVYVPEGFLTSCSFDYLTSNYKAKIFIWIFFIAAWVVPFILIAFCYVNIMNVVLFQRNVKDIESLGESTRHVKEEEKRKQDLHFTLVVFSVVGLWFIAWTPYAVIALLGITENTTYITPLSSMIPALFCKTASCVDPYVYALSNPRFKKEFLSLCRQKSLQKISTQVWNTKTSFKQPPSNFRRTSESFSEEIPINNLIESKEPSCIIPKETQLFHLKDFSQESTSASSVVSDKLEMNDSKSGKRHKIKPCISFEDTAGVFKGNEKVKKAWWYKPSFSNKASTIRKLSRTYSAKEHAGSSEFESAHKSA